MTRTSTSRTARRALVWGLAGLVLTAGCTGAADETDDGTFSERLRALEPAKPVDLPTALPETAGDAERVADALWSLDACALVPDALGDGGRTLDRDGPHSCGFDHRGRSPEIRVGAYFGEDERLQYGTARIAGAKAYEVGGENGDDESNTSCFVAVPVGPTHAIAVDDQKDSGRTSCDLSRRVAAYAIRTVRKADPAHGAGDDTCGVLRAALGEDARGRRLVYGGHDTDIDSCAALSGQPPSPESDTEPEEYAYLTVDNFRVEGPVGFRIAGREIHRSVYPSGTTSRTLCTLSWHQDSATVNLTTGSCARSRHLTERAIAFYDRPAAQTSQSTPRVRFYRPGEQDRGGSGACAHYVSLWQIPGYDIDASVLAPHGPGCRPAGDAELPDDPAQLLRDAEANPDVLCTLAKPAVDEASSHKLYPVTLAASPEEAAAVATIGSRPCVFVDPSDGSQVLVFASTERLPAHLARESEYSSDDDLQRYVPGTELDALLSPASQELGDSAGDPGYLTVMAGPDPPFDSEMLGLNTLDSGAEERAGTILDAIVDEYFEE